jgi:hypothetical protein
MDASCMRAVASEEKRVRIENRMGRSPASALALLVAAIVLASTAAAAQAVTLSPLNGTPDASPHTQISFLGAPAGQIADVSVKGSRSGSHSGKLRSYARASCRPAASQKASA